MESLLWSLISDEGRLSLERTCRSGETASTLMHPAQQLAFSYLGGLYAPALEGAHRAAATASYRKEVASPFMRLLQ